MPEQPPPKGKIRVRSPEGEVGLIPVEDLPVALSEGFTPVRGQFDQPGFQETVANSFSPGNVLSNVFQGVKNVGSTVLQAGGAMMEGGPINLAKKFVVDPAIEQFKKAASEESLVARTASGVAATIPLVGPFAASIGEQMGTGDVGGGAVRGGTEAAVMGTAFKVPAAIRGTRAAIGRVLPRTPTGELKPLIRSGIERVFPEAPERVAARQMEQKAKDLLLREKEQGKLDSAQRKSQVMEERIRNMRQKEGMQKAAAEDAARAENAISARSTPNPNPARPRIGQSSESLLKEELQKAAAEDAARSENAAFGRSTPNMNPPPRRATQSAGERIEELSGNRPSPSEAHLTELLRKQILTPSEIIELQRAFGSDWVKMRGEGVADMQARLLGTLRARRAGRGMAEPQ